MEKEHSITTIDLFELMFVYLKLTKQINWSWIWVLSPWWLAFVLLFVFGVIKAVRNRRKKQRDVADVEMKEVLPEGDEDED